MAFQMTNLGAPMAQPPINFNISLAGNAGNPTQQPVMGQPSSMLPDFGMTQPINFNIALAGNTGGQARQTIAAPSSGPAVAPPEQQFSSIVQQYDRNQDGALSNEEILLGANELAIRKQELTDISMMPGSESLHIGEQLNRINYTGSIFNTFLNGGANGTGLLPDANQDGLITQAEIDQLAAADGDATTLNSADFSTAFNDQGVYQPGGAQPPATGGQQGFIQLMQSMMQLMTTMLGFMSNLFQR